MLQRDLRIEIFKILFEHEVTNADVTKRMEEFLNEHKISNSKQEFFKEYINGVVDNSELLVTKIKEKLQGWTYERLGFVEKTLLKMSFYEILIKDMGHEIVINETVELAKLYGDLKTKEFINGILAGLIQG